MIKLGNKTAQSNCSRCILILTAVTTISRVRPNPRTEPVHSGIHAGVIRFGATLAPRHNPRDLVHIVRAILLNHVQWTSAIALAGVFLSLVVPCAQHVVCDTRCPVSRLSTVGVWHDWNRYLLQICRDGSVFWCRTPSRHNALVEGWKRKDERISKEASWQGSICLLTYIVSSERFLGRWQTNWSKFIFNGHNGR